jgi:hypothetical protein
MQRRKFIQNLTFGGSLAAIGGGYIWLNTERDHPELSLSVTLQEFPAA